MTHVACAFDNPIESFRNRLFPTYKSSAGVPEELLAQFDQAEDASRALGIVTWPMDEYEADDALATAALRCAAQVEVGQVVICSPDKDLAQVVDGERIVTFDRIPVAQAVTRPGVRERFGVPPASVPDFLALVGDGRRRAAGHPALGRPLGGDGALPLRQHRGDPGGSGRVVGAAPAAPRRWRETSTRSATGRCSTSDWPPW